MYQCRIEKHSVPTCGVNEALSFVITFPRIVLAETVTHRVNCDSWCERTTTEDISKNSASSRAIPFTRMVAAVLRDPYIPERFSKNGPGMQGHGWLEGEEHDEAVALWLKARDRAVESAEALHKRGVHKQDVNRLLEPFVWVTQIVTSSQWDNFFALRCHAAAHPAFQKIARMMFLAKRASKPEVLEYGQWHLPFVSDADAKSFKWYPVGQASIEPFPFTEPKVTPETMPDLIRFSAARCAWVSYDNHDRDGTPEKMLDTWQKLIGNTPRHASPIEHQLTPLPRPGYSAYRSNIEGWIQARKLLPDERVNKYDPSDEEIASWGLGDISHATAKEPALV